MLSGPSAERARRGGERYNERDMGDSRGRFRIVSANLANGRAEPALLARLIEALQPDAVAFQELAPRQADAVARLMSHGRLDPRTDHFGMGIALRRPGRLWRVPLPYRDAHVAEVAPAGWNGAGPVEIVNAHIAAPHVSPIWRALRRRRGQLRELEAYLDGERARRRVVVGDLNSTAVWPLYRRLTARFTDAAREAARRGGGWAPRTWAPWPGGPYVLRIDHALVHGLSAAAVRVVPLPRSDHGALVVDLLPADDGGAPREAPPPR
jgi:endonuclease/exonuclease/phosphatase family metal-dependent hydrolase